MHQRLLRRDWLCSIVLAAVVPALAGCSGKKGPEVVRVSGTVTRNGQPVPNLFLNFVPTQGRPSWGITDEQGRYTLNYTRGQDGAVTGTHKVWVKYKPSDPGEEMAMMQGRAKVPQELAEIVEKYGKQETTPLEFQISEDGQVIDIALD